MSFWTKKSNDVTYGVLIDISSGSIGIGIVESDSSLAQPKIIFSQRVPFSLRNDSGVDSRAISEALFSAALILSEEGMRVFVSHNKKGKITDCFVTCSSPWAFTIARSVQYNEASGFKITRKMVDDLIREAETEMYATARDNAVIKDNGFEVVEKATVDVAVNEYVVSRPQNLHGTSLELSHIAGLIPKNIMSTVHEVHEKLFPATHLRIHTSMLVSYCTLRDVFPKVHSLCIVSVTAEATEFGVVENNLLIRNSFIPYGSDTLAREYAEKTGRPIADVRTMILEHANGTSNTNDTLGPLISSYQDRVASHIAEIIGNQPLPNHVVVTTHVPYTTLFCDVIREAILTSTKKVHTIVPLDADLLQEPVIDNSVQSTDMYLVVVSRFFHKLHCSAEVNTDE